MIHAGADSAQAQGDVYGTAKGDQLHRNGRLVVVHGHDAVETFGVGQSERGLRSHRTGDVYPVSKALSGQAQARLDRLALFAAQQLALTRVWVEGADRNARL